LGRDAESAVPALRERLRDESSDHCVQAWLALCELGRQSDPETIDVLRDLRKRGTAGRQALAENWLHELGVQVDTPGE
jgi:HEAT repeat protein